MKLYMWPTSPYVAKTLAVAEFKNLHNSIDLVYVHPWQTDSFIPKDNPLGKIPTLVLDDGRALYDSSVICEYLDSKGQGSKLFPDSTLRWEALRLQALANGIMDAGVAIQYEMRFRPESKQCLDWGARQLKAIDRSLIEANKWFANGIDGDCIGTISIAMSIAYLQLRVPEVKELDKYPALINWFNEYIQRPFMYNNKPSLKDMPNNMEKLVA